jgi:hypothetical protein
MSSQAMHALLWLLALAYALGVWFWLAVIVWWVLSLGWLLLLVLAVGYAGALPDWAAPVVAPMIAGGWLWFWLAVAIAWIMGLVPASYGWQMRRLYRKFDRLQRLRSGLGPPLSARLVPFRDVACVLTIAGGAARCFGWW